MKKLIIISLLVSLFACGKVSRNPEIAIIPRPVSMEVDRDGGEFIFSSPFTICYPEGDSVLLKAAQFYAKELTERLALKTINITTKKQSNAITLALSDEVRAEGYELEVQDNKIEIEVSDYSGAIYALQTLLQLMPPEVYAAGQLIKETKVAIPNIKIEDYPRFGYRGMHLDCSRHFFAADSVKRYIDMMAMHKFNRFHWHLTDDQGWRMESKRYPLLTQKSAFRVDRNAQPWDDRQPIDTTKGEKPTYGGFYTQEQIRDIVAYAADRGIEVIPEIEIPGHSAEVFAAYPALSCLGVEQQVTPGGYYPPDMATCFCAGNEDVFTFLRNILDETIELFPSAPYIHIGGDEVDKRFWEACPKCQARMKAEGLKNLDELQSYFIKRIEKFVNSQGKNILGWDEIIEGGLSPKATVMSWRGIAGGIQAAQQGHDVVMTPNSHLYFDYHQSNPLSETNPVGGLITTKTVYDFEPIPDALNEQESRHILGAQANIWTEYLRYFSDVERMALPRMAALAEVNWSPIEGKDWTDFSRRLVSDNARFAAMGANYHRGSQVVEMHTAYDSLSKVFSVAMVSEIYGSQIHYTLDGTEPTTASPIYTNPIEIKESVTIKAIITVDDKPLSTIASERAIGIHKGIGRTILQHQPQPSVQRHKWSTHPDRRHHWHNTPQRRLYARLQQPQLRYCCGYGRTNDNKIGRRIVPSKCGRVDLPPL